MSVTGMSSHSFFHIGCHYTKSFFLYVSWTGGRFSKCISYLVRVAYIYRIYIPIVYWSARRIKVLTLNILDVNESDKTSPVVQLQINACVIYFSLRRSIERSPGLILTHCRCRPIKRLPRILSRASLCTFLILFLSHFFLASSSSDSSAFNALSRGQQRNNVMTLQLRHVLYYTYIYLQWKPGWNETVGQNGPNGNPRLLLSMSFIGIWEEVNS